MQVLNSYDSSSSFNGARLFSMPANPFKYLSLSSITPKLKSIQQKIKSQLVKISVLNEVQYFFNTHEWKFLIAIEVTATVGSIVLVENSKPFTVSASAFSVYLLFKTFIKRKNELTLPFPRELVENILLKVVEKLKPEDQFQVLGRFASVNHGFKSSVEFLRGRILKKIHIFLP